MATLFVYDGGIIRKDTFYYTINFGNDLIERYSFFNNEVEYLMREKEFKIEDESKYTLLTHKNFKFTSIPNLCSIKGLTVDSFKINKIIKDRVNSNSIIIIRLPSFAGFKAIKECNRLKKTYIIELVGCPWDAFWNHSVKGKIVAPVAYYKTKKAIRNAPYVIYVTNEFLQKRYSNKKKNIGCSDVYLPSFDEEILHKRLVRIKQMRLNKPVILGTTAAVDIRYKGQKYVIKALSKLKREGYNFEYHLVGGGDICYLKKIAEKYNLVNEVKFLGSIPHADVFEYLDNLDIYIQPSKQEGLPRALIEALSRGCPSIGSTTGGIPELLADECIFHNGSVTEIANLLKKMKPEIMFKEATRCFNKAKEYDKILLKKKRTTFYKDFLKKEI